MNFGKRDMYLSKLADRQNGDRFAYSGCYRLPVSLKWLVPPCLAQWCQIGNKSVRRLRAHHLTVRSDHDLKCSRERLVAEVRIDRTAVANPVCRSLRFENLDGSRILGKSNERPKRNTKQNPL